MVESSCIKVWTRDQVPEEYSKFATIYDDGEIENTVFVAHIPASILNDRFLRQCVETSNSEGYLWWESRGLFATNCIEKLPEPSGDGVIIVGGWV